MYCQAFYHGVMYCYYVLLFESRTSSNIRLSPGILTLLLKSVGVFQVAFAHGNSREGHVLGGGITISLILSK